jgi:hypothetical protein
MSNVSDLWKFPLTRGNSTDPENGACVMDAVSWFEYGKLGDHPDCTCPVIAAYLRRFNDRLPDEQRQRLKEYIPRLIGTVDKDAAKARRDYLVWNVLKVIVPIMLESRGFIDDANAMRNFNGTFIEARNSYRLIAKKLRAYADAVAADAADAVAAYADAAYADAAVAAYADAGAADADAVAAVADAVAAVADAVAAVADAAYAGAVAAVADAATKQKIYDAQFTALDNVLLIGKQADPIDMGDFKQACDAFAVARGKLVSA